MTARQASAIIAVVSEDGSDPVRARAIELAREAGDDLILWDAESGGRLLEDPLPNQYSADGEEEQFGERLTVNDLEAAGRGPLARQVREAEAAGVRAWGWLPSDQKTETLRDYAARHGVGTVVVARGAEIAGDLEAAALHVEIV